MSGPSYLKLDMIFMISLVDYDLRLPNSFCICFIYRAGELFIPYLRFSKNSFHDSLKIPKCMLRGNPVLTGNSMLEDALGSRTNRLLNVE